jgi:hypothetical protein
MDKTEVGRYSKCNIDTSFSWTWIKYAKVHA